MYSMHRRSVLATGLGAAALLASRSPAQAADLGFLSFTYAEEANKSQVQALIDGFQAKSGLSVEPLGSAWGDVQRNLVLRQRSRTLPAVAQLTERWLPSFAAMPELVDLNQVFGAPALKVAMEDSVLAYGQVGGRQLALPWITGSIGGVAQTDVLKASGVEEVPTTVDAFRKAMVSVRDKVPNSVPYAMATKNPASIPIDVLLWVWAFGGRIVQEDGTVTIASAEGRAAFEFLAGMMKDRLIAPEIDRPDARRLFGQGASAFYFDAPQARTFARSFSGKGPAADAFVMPAKTPVLKPGDTPKSIQWGHLLVLFSPPSAKASDAAGAKFIAHLLSEEAQSTYPLAQGALPATRAGRNSEALKKDPYFAQWAAAGGQPLANEIGVWSNAPELNTILAEETQAALLGQKTASAAVDALQTRLSASMAKRAG